MNICPTQAITMQTDEYGFVYPVINTELCIECELCETVCAYRNIPVSNDEPLATYAAVNKDQSLLLTSSSGGIFGALASLVFEQNGLVFGSAWNTTLEPEHICIDKPADLNVLQGSKYVQSNINYTYAESKKYLEQGRTVLFTGTPCQIAGLKGYLGKDYENLITADIVCHGVPNIVFFKSYIGWLENKLKGKLTDYKFRDKSKLGISCVGKVCFHRSGKSREKIIYWSIDPYYSNFMYGHIYRESCYECKYAGAQRQGDFTMGDYWGVQRFHPEIETEKGVSVFLVNTEKGTELVSKLQEYLYLTPSTFEQASFRNEQLRQPISRRYEREIILKIWKDHGFEAVASDFYRRNKKKIIIHHIKTKIPVGAKKIIKMLCTRFDGHAELR